MDQRIDLVICLGSSCFSRGNKRILALIQEYLKVHDLEDKVIFRGNRCFDNCARGPVVKLGDKVYYGVEEGNLENILREAFREFAG